MKQRKLRRFIAVTFLLGAGWAPQQERVLVFSKTAAFRHGSIEAGVDAIRKLGEANNFAVDATEDASVFREDNLSRYAAVVFLSTTGDVLTADQQAAFERYIRAGGGYVGVHAASDTEYDWPWYGRLVGAYFVRHPAIQEATLHVVDPTHVSTEFLDSTWRRTDEWYDFRSINPDINVVLTIDEASYQGATTGDPHPMAWHHRFEGGRAFYTALGHTSEGYDDHVYLRHLLGGIQYAIGER